VLDYTEINNLGRND